MEKDMSNKVESILKDLRPALSKGVESFKPNLDQVSMILWAVAHQVENLEYLEYLEILGRHRKQCQLPICIAGGPHEY